MFQSLSSDLRQGSTESADNRYVLLDLWCFTLHMACQDSYFNILALNEYLPIGGMYTPRHRPYLAKPALVPWPLSRGEAHLMHTWLLEVGNSLACML